MNNLFRLSIIIILSGFVANLSQSLKKANPTKNSVIYPYILPQPQNYSITANSENLIITPSSFIYQIVPTNEEQNLSPITYNIEKIFSQYQSKIFYTNASVTKATQTLLNIQIKNTTVINPSLETDESYSLTTSNYTISLQCETYYGFVRGIETLSQLIQAQANSTNGQILYYYYPTEVIIYDRPYFMHRGVMIDTARHFISKASLLRQIDVMMYNKLNVLHWHITDSQSFPIYISSRPYLSEYGAYNDSCVYSIGDVSEIVEYAKIRAVRVIPEIDTPGHSRAWALSPQMKDIGVCMDCNWNKCAAGPPAGMINPTLNETYILVEDVIGSIEAQFIDEVIHLGGDEVNEVCLEQEPSIATWMKANNISNYSQLQAYYTQRERALLKTGKTAAYWRGSSKLIDSLKDGDIIQYWGKSNLTSFLSNYPQLKVILSPADVMYLDCGFSNLLGNASWCNPYNTWRDILLFNPLENLTKQQVLGGEVCMWGDLLNDDNIDRKIWMRGSALADKYWNYENNSITKDSVRRLIKMYHELLNRGIGADPITSEFCELDIDYCFEYMQEED